MPEQVLELSVPGISCGHCVSAVTTAIKELDPDARVAVSLADKRVTIETNEPLETITERLAEAGYPVAQ